MSRKRIQGRLQDTTFQQYQTMKAALGFTETNGSDDLCLRALLETYDQSRTPTCIPVSETDILHLLQYTKEETDEIAQALALEYTDFWHLVRTGLLREVRNVNTNRAKLETLDITPTTDRTRNRVRGSAYLRVKSCVDELMRANLAATTMLDITYITRGIVADRTKSHSEYVSEYFSQHEAALATHHQALGFSSHEMGIRHNRLRARVKKQDTLKKEMYGYDFMEKTTAEMPETP